MYGKPPFRSFSQSRRVHSCLFELQAWIFICAATWLRNIEVLPPVREADIILFGLQSLILNLNHMLAVVRTVDYNGNSLPAKPPVSEVNGYATPDWSPAKLNGFAAYAHSPYSAEDDAEEPDFNCSQRSSLQLDLQTVHSGAEMDHTKQQVDLRAASSSEASTLLGVT